MHSPLVDQALPGPSFPNHHSPEDQRSTCLDWCGNNPTCVRPFFRFGSVAR